MLPTLQTIVAGAKHLASRVATQDIGNWMDRPSIQATYNRNSVPGNDQMTQVEGGSAIVLFTVSLTYTRYSKQTFFFLSPSSSFEPVNLSC